MEEADRQKLIKANIASVVQNSPKESYQENRVRTFYEGNQYMLFVVETFKDVRLVVLLHRLLVNLEVTPTTGYGQDTQATLLFLEFMQIKIIVLLNIRKITFPTLQNTSFLFL